MSACTTKTDHVCKAYSSAYKINKAKKLSWDKKIGIIKQYNVAMWK